MVDRFGAEAVYGRAMRYPELYRVQLAENVAAAYRSYKASLESEGGGAGWGQEHPDAAALVIWARKQAGR